eukprot:Plantae.Rhodophyta-Hildenbrandia_rubra.ctg4567.p1 GENE.Plantae.Rhodophyta-Hildenbrandia_rubra.ctg4567~~Plantae.Rhodophyta-Hildenbrandia_rubra.ctg4567.p1  ORF type:complete len:183 (+),score=49.95 Plantae.Rhodophyta-Hildenbrandia_rubra.ctg4567:90-638(+)
MPLAFTLSPVWGRSSIYHATRRSHAICALEDNEHWSPNNTQRGARDAFRDMARDLGSTEKSSEKESEVPRDSTRDSESMGEGEGVVDEASVWGGWQNAEGRWRDEVENAGPRDLKAEVDRWRSAARELTGDEVEKNAARDESVHREGFKQDEKRKPGNTQEKKGVDDFWKNMARDIGGGDGK